MLETHEILVDIESGKIKSSIAVVAVVADDLLSVDLSLAHKWHVPQNEREYLRSPQKAQWRNAREIKMDTYKQINVFKLMKRADVPSGFKVYRSLWAHTIKFNADGSFNRLGVRWWHGACKAVTWTATCMRRDPTPFVSRPSRSLPQCVQLIAPI